MMENYFIRINFSENINLYLDGQENIPNWMIPKKSISYGFGGKLFKYSKNENSKKNNEINIYKLNGNKQLIKEIKNFLDIFEKKDIRDILNTRIEEAKNQNINNMNNQILLYTALKSIFERNYDLIFNELGLNREDFSEEISSTLGFSKKKTKIKEIDEIRFGESIENLEDIFNQPVKQYMEE